VLTQKEICSKMIRHSHENKICRWKALGHVWIFGKKWELKEASLTKEQKQSQLESTWCTKPLKTQVVIYLFTITRFGGKIIFIIWKVAIVQQNLLNLKPNN
jgi:hypothetical protein